MKIFKDSVEYNGEVITDRQLKQLLSGCKTVDDLIELVQATEGKSLKYIFNPDFCKFSNRDLLKVFRVFYRKYKIDLSISQTQQLFSECKSVDELGSLVCGTPSAYIRPGDVKAKLALFQLEDDNQFR